jgi:hypothetical protein
LIAVVDHHRRRITIPHRNDELATHIDDVRQDAEALLQAVNNEMGINLVPSSLAEFPGFPTPRRLLVRVGAPPTARYLKAYSQPDEFLLVTGTGRHYLLPRPTIDPCAGHTWSECHALHENQLDAAIVDRSFMPPSFFRTVELHHCAHRTVHNRRQSRCHIASFEEFLCCRACVFEAACWTPQELARLPCGVTGPNVPAHVAAAAVAAD